MTIIVVDARDRRLPIFWASVTTVSGGEYRPGLVVRKAVHTGDVNRLPGYANLPPILVMGAYEAQSSAGFVEILGAAGAPVFVLGGSGFGRDVYDLEAGEMTRRGDALRRFRRPIDATLLPAGCSVSKIWTHSNLNSATARTARDGLRFWAAMETNTVVLMEGQSNTTQAFALRVPKNAVAPDLPEEHRRDIFVPADPPEHVVSVEMETVTLLRP